MRHWSRIARLVLTSAALLASGTKAASAQDATLQQMVGTWRVEQRLWSGPGVEPITAPPTAARRRLVNDVFLEEVMEVTGDGAFTRIAYFNYNGVTSDTSRCQWIRVHRT